MEEVGRLSARGKCRECAEQRVVENHHDLRRHSGPWFQHWRTRSLAALGVVVDERRDEG